ncbi:hypothetical protein [Mesorhizobium sp. L-8-3]|uniref:hypothetical protein n=1 Tax=Mesorhizobium sp. L-8-3 TaxID=2744522 RepID=UPI00192699A8|nr:hypothetical protein [Mesorhizobium sp. L-8-3]BCH22086.1 hypothetical protein MesoLjLb_18710 [Mesorhizobium sp. L-8-3]
MSNIPPLPPGFRLLDEEQAQMQGPATAAQAAGGAKAGQTIPPPPPGFSMLPDTPQDSAGIRQARTGAQGFADLVTFGLADEAAAAVGSLGGMLPGGHGKGYSELLDEIRGQSEAEAAEFPKTNLAGKVTGGVSGGVAAVRGGLSLAANAAQAGKGWLPRLLGGAADGGIAAGLYGFGSGEGVKDRLQQAAYNAPLGAAFGAGGEGLVMGLGAGWRSLFSGADDVARGINPAANVAEAGQFGIPLTRAQATRSIKQANIEDQLGATGAMQSFKEGQTQAVDDALGAMQGRLAGSNRPVPDAATAWDSVQSGLRGTRDRLKAAGQDAYAASVDNPNVLVSGQAVAALPNFIRSSLDADNIIIDPMYHAGAARALQFVDDYISRMPQVGGDVKSVQAQLRWVENLRASLGKNFPPIGPDAPALGAIKGAIDDWTDEVFERGLVSASDDVLGQLKTARANWSHYKGLIEPKAKRGGRINPQYEAQARVRNIIEKDMSPAEIGQYLFGSSVVSPKNMSFATANELKRHLGADSAEWAGVRQALWLRAVRAGDDAMSPAKIAKNLDGLLKGDGKGLAQVVFSADERSAMGSFANVMRMLSLPKGGLNNSNTANRLIPQLQRWGSAVAGMLSGGAGAYGGLDPLSSLGLGALTTGALKAVGAGARQAKASAATRMPVPVRPSGSGGATLRGLSQPFVPMVEDMRKRVPVR